MRARAMVGLAQDTAHREPVPRAGTPSGEMIRGHDQNCAKGLGRDASSRIARRPA